MLWPALAVAAAVAATDLRCRLQGRRPVRLRAALELLGRRGAKQRWLQASSGCSSSRGRRPSRQYTSFASRHRRCRRLPGPGPGGCRRRGRRLQPGCCCSAAWLGQRGGRRPRRRRSTAENPSPSFALCGPARTCVPSSGPSCLRSLKNLRPYPPPEGSWGSRTALLFTGSCDCTCARQQLRQLLGAWRAAEQEAASDVARDALHDECTGNAKISLSITRLLVILSLKSYNGSPASTCKQTQKSLLKIWKIK